MYNEFFHFNEQPFSLTPDPKFTYLSRGHQTALEHLIYGVRERKGFILLSGNVGAGKTTLTRLFIDQLDDEVHTAVIFNTFLNEVELLRAINREFGLPSDGTGREELIRTLNEFLVEKLREGTNVVLILDEAQNLSIPVLEQIRMLSNLETDNQKLIQIVLSGQPEINQILARPDLAQLSQRVTVRCNLGPLSLEESERYVQHRMTVAGPMGVARFETAAYRLIYKMTEGVPRRINALCDRALLVAYAKGSHKVTPDYIRQAQAELEGRFGRESGRSHTGLRRAFTVGAVVVLLALAAYLGYTAGGGSMP